MKSGKSHISGEIEAELEALTTHAGVCRREDRMAVRVVGDDRASFLHGMCSNDIKGLQPGTLTYALILTDHAHVVADIYVWAADDAIYLEVDRGLWPRTREHLEKFLVADDVEMEEQEQWTIMELVGPQSAAAVGSIAPPATGLAPWRFVRHQGLLVAHLPRIGLTAFTVVVPTSQAESLVREISSAHPETREVSVAALEVLRVEQGSARVGVDATEKTIALEARLQNGISYNKGCYVGQETIERATARGGVKKRLYGLRIAGRKPQPGATAWMDGKEVGLVTSVAASPRLGILGLGIMHHSAWKPGASVTLKDPDGDVTAVMSELPFE
ncbi:MAG TPA: glycine cleavage T C-terminal barrel domain-containing protein [Candidatus Binataceae bacterium]